MPDSGYQQMERLVHRLEKAALSRKRYREKLRQRMLEEEKRKLERTIHQVEKMLPYA
jgi:hypothetical protein